MRPSRGSMRAALAALLLIVASRAASTVLTVRAAPPTPAFDHVFIVVEENHNYTDIIGNTQAPYINGLASQNGLAVQYSGVSHPSLPNYLALTGGSTFGVTTDCAPTACPINAPNIADRIEGGGKTWKAYMDAMPSACGVSDSGTYAVRHDPFVYYNDIRNNSARCSSHVVPYPNLATDLASASTTPNYAWITPDVCNDMHDCQISVGDTWLKNNLPAIFGSPAWTTQKSVLLLTWDEGSTNHVATLAIGPTVRAGYQSSAAYTHYSLLKTVESAWNLAPLTTNDANASPMNDFFITSTPPIWSAGYASSTPTSWAPGETKSYAVTVTNTGNQTWPAGGSAPVHLGVHFATSGGGFSTNISSWLTDQRFSLPADLAPNGSVTLTVSVTAPNTTGNLVLEYQMVKETQFWFAPFADVNVTVGTPVWSASYAVTNPPPSWTPGQTQTYTVTVTNTGNQTWPAGGSAPVHLGVHFATSGGGFSTNISSWLTDQRFSLPADLAPNGSVTLMVSVTAPNTTANLVLEYQMVKETQFWFTQFADVNVTVGTPVWSAGYTVSNPPTSWTHGQTQTYTVTVTNTGNQTWPAGGSTPVHLGVHFATSGGGFSTNISSWLTDRRFSLPADLAPNGSVTLTVSVTAPNTTGNLVLEYQMVKETQFWFTQVADTNVTLA